jgi:hypothetical protein
MRRIASPPSACATTKGHQSRVADDRASWATPRQRRTAACMDNRVLTPPLNFGQILTLGKQSAYTHLLDR